MSFFKKALGTVAKFGGPIGTAVGGPLGGMIGGALGSAVGGKLSSDAMKKANRNAAQAAQFNPWNVGGPGGSFNFDPETNQMTGAFDPNQQALFDQMGGSAMGQLGGGANAGFQGFAGGLGGQMPGLWNQYMQASNNVPNQAFDQFGGNMNALNQMAAGGAGGFLGQAMGPGGNQGLSNAMFGMGMGMQNQNVDQYRDIASNQLDLMRNMAAPQEERALNNIEQRMFNRGQMHSEGGARNYEAFAQGQSNADDQRQLQAQGFAEGLYRGDQQFAQGQQQLGQGLMGMGFQGQTNDTSRQLGMGYLGQGMLGTSGNFNQNMLNAQIGQSDMINARAEGRIGQAMGTMFGGQNLQNQQFQNAMMMQQGQGGMLNQIGNMGTLGANVGGQQASAGANQAGYLAKNNTSNTGSFLSNVGGKLLDKGIQHFLPKIFPGS